jgi:hypothetical protein
MRLVQHEINAIQHGRGLPRRDCEGKTFVGSRNHPQFERVCSDQRSDNDGCRAHASYTHFPGHGNQP